MLFSGVARPSSDKEHQTSGKSRWCRCDWQRRTVANSTVALVETGGHAGSSISNYYEDRSPRRGGAVAASVDDADPIGETYRRTRA